MVPHSRATERERFYLLVDNFPIKTIAITAGPIPHFQTDLFFGMRNQQPQQPRFAGGGSLEGSHAFSPEEGALC